jgi:hypothetical protein
MKRDGPRGSPPAGHPSDTRGSSAGHDLSYWVTVVGSDELAWYCVAPLNPTESQM